MTMATFSGEGVRFYRLEDMDSQAVFGLALSPWAGSDVEAAKPLEPVKVPPGQEPIKGGWIQVTRAAKTYHQPLQISFSHAFGWTERWDL